MTQPYGREGEGGEGRVFRQILLHVASAVTVDPVQFSSVHDFIAPQKGVAATGDAHEAAALLHRGGIVL